MPQKPYYEYENFKFWAKNGLNRKLEHRKAQKMILFERYGDPYVQETGRLVSYLGNSWIIWESWRVRNFSSFYAMSAKVTMSLWLVFPDEIS